MVLQRVSPTTPPTATYNSFKYMLRDFLKIVIKDNHFRFENDYYDQVKGVAMGTRCAPPFANLFLAALEENALAEWSGPAPALWKRFLDDVLMIWTSTKDTLDKFLLHLNQQMSAIKFTCKSSTKDITFLDLKLYKGGRFRSTGVLDTSSCEIHQPTAIPALHLLPSCSHFLHCHQGRVTEGTQVYLRQRNICGNSRTAAYQIQEQGLS